MKTQLFSWSTFGKISLVIVTLWTLVQIFEWYGNGSGHLSATIEISKYNFPIEIKDKFEYDYQNRFTRDLLDSISNKFELPKIKEYDSFSFLLGIEETIRRLVNDRLSSKYFDNYYDYNLLEIQIINNSDKLVESISIDLDQKGYYQIIDQNDKLASGIFDHNLKIGDIRALNSCTFLMWTSRWIDSEDVIIKYDNGVIVPSEIIKVSGFYAWLGKYSIYYNLILRLLPTIYIGFIIYLLVKYLYSKIKKNHQVELNQEKTKEDNI